MLAGYNVLKHQVVNEQYARCVRYQIKSHDEAINPWILAPGSYWWRKPEKLNLNPTKFYESDEDKNEQYKKPMIANNLEKISQKS